MIPRNKVEKKNQGMLYFEFQLLRNLDHPHIIRIYDLYKDQRYIYMITELCEGGDIFSMIQKADNFNEKIASRIMKQAMNAVLYCHSNGIVHRDIKSDNILFLENNIDSPIKLIDFGISLKFEKNTKLKDKTGTVLYIAPEVLQGSYDEKCDIWSCGVLMYMMLSGVPPFYGATRKEVMQKISKGKFSFKSKVWSIISKHFFLTIKTGESRMYGLEIGTKKLGNTLKYPRSKYPIPLVSGALMNPTNALSSLKCFKTSSRLRLTS